MDNVYDKNIRISLGKDFSKFMPITVKFSEIPNIVCSPNVLYSPTQYANNERKAANFLGFTDILIFDFDEGWTKEKDDFFIICFVLCRFPRLRHEPALSYPTYEHHRP